MARAEKNITRLQYEANCHDYRGDVSLVSMLSSLILSSANVIENQPVLRTAVGVVFYTSLAETWFSTGAYVRKARIIKKKHEASGEALPEVSTRHFFTRRNLYRSPSIS